MDVLFLVPGLVMSTTMMPQFVSSTGSVRRIVASIDGLLVVLHYDDIAALLLCRASLNQQTPVGPLQCISTSGYSGVTELNLASDSCIKDINIGTSVPLIKVDTRPVLQYSTYLVPIQPFAVCCL
jgi:hypothetical protein